MPSKPRVLVDARYRENPRGGDRCRYELSVRLRARETEHYSFLGYAHAVKELRQNGHDFLTAQYLPSQHPQADIFEHFTLPKLVRSSKADIYHGTFNVLPARGTAAINVVTVHDMAVYAVPQAYSAKFGPMMRYLIKESIKRADCIVTVSDATREEIFRFLPWARSKRCVTILNGAGPEFYAASKLPQEQVDTTLQRLNIPSPYVLFVGNLEVKKNLKRLIEGFVLGKERYGWKHSLVIVGEKPDKLPAEVVPEGTDLPTCVRFTGYLSDADLPTLYRGADVVAYPSIYEGFGLPVLEGMAAGRPVLTSTVSSLPEVAGGCALLVDPYDVEAIAAGLERALTDEEWREGAIAAGLARASQLSWEANATQTAELYRELAAKR